MDSTEQLMKCIEQLEEQIILLQQKVRRLSATFLPNPQYPYWHILIALDISEDKKIELESIMFILTDRLLGRKFIVKHDAEISDKLIEEMAEGGTNHNDRIISASTISRYPRNLVQNSLPTWEESLTIISTVLGIASEDTIKRILCAMRKQSMFVQLIDFLFSNHIRR